MKTIHRIIVFCIILILAFTGLAAAPLVGNPLVTGAWKGIDLSDGSKIEVRITNSYFVNYFDSASAYCSGGKVKGSGAGSLLGSSLVTSLRLKCTATNTIVAKNIALTFTYDSATGLLYDSNGNSYSKVKGAGCGR